MQDNSPIVMARNVCSVHKFVERDIDMLIAEELRVNPEFCKWILAHFKIEAQVSFPAVTTRVSVVEDGSEADVIATFDTSSGPYGLFIENKIDATLMPEQLERYVRRAEGELRRGSISAYSVLFFTPSTYFRASLPDGVVQISFEDAATALRSRPAGLRSDYRASLLERAVPLRTPALRDAHVAEVDPYIKEWWEAVYAMLEREFPGFFLPSRTRYPRSVYFAPQMAQMGSYLRVDFKGHKGEVDLAFKNVPFDEMKVLLAEINEVPGRLVANGRSSALQISGLEPFVIADGTAIIETKVRAAYQAAYDLLSFWQKFRGQFDTLADRDR